MKGIAVLGCTGSIGRQALEVIRAFPDKFKVASLASRGRDLDLLEQQAREFSPRLVAVADEESARALRSRLPNIEVVSGSRGIWAASSLPEVSLVLNAIGGVEGLEATQAAVEQGKDLALANKESLVVAGALVTREAKQKGTKLLPVDSEHVAIHQCLSGQARMIDRLVLTASGGPFYRWPAEALNTVTPAMAVNHPTWRMGPKISVDSATLMNKALEVIEAHWLFGTPLAQIEVVIHPQSIVHSLVVFGDGMALAQVGPPDMRLPIQYALSWPETLPNRYVSWSVTNLPTLTFEPPDEKNFPCLRLGREAAERGGSYPAVLAGADEEAVALFLEGKIRFTDIPRIVEEVLAEHRPMGDLTWGNLKEVVGWARRRARQRGENLWARR